jgi:hypothetical protein
MDFLKTLVSSFLGAGVSCVAIWVFFFRQQTQALEATIRSKDAEIQRLNALSAPAIASDFEKMTKVAEAYAKRLQQSYEAARKQRELGTMSETAAVASALLEGSAGLMLVRNDIVAETRRALDSGQLPDPYRMFRRLDSTSETLVEETKAVLAGQKAQWKLIEEFESERKNGTAEAP